MICTGNLENYSGSDNADHLREFVLQVITSFTLSTALAELRTDLRFVCFVPS